MNKNTIINPNQTEIKKYKESSTAMRTQTSFFNNTTFSFKNQRNSILTDQIKSENQTKRMNILYKKDSSITQCIQESNS